MKQVIKTVIAGSERRYLKCLSRSPLWPCACMHVCDPDQHVPRPPPDVARPRALNMDLELAREPREYHLEDFRRGWFRNERSRT